MSESERAPLGVRVLLTDVVALTCLSLLALSPLADAFDGPRWVVAAVGGLVIGIGSTLVARQLKWGPLLTALLVVVTYFLAGPALAVPGRAIGGVLPSPGGERDLMTGTIDGWRNALTLPAQLGTDFQVLVVPLIIATVGAVFAATFLWRSRWPSIAAFGIIAMFVAAATFGTRATDLPLVRGLVLAVALLVWIRWRDLRTVRTSWPRRVALTGAVVALASLAGWGLNTATAGDGTRQVLRDHVDPPLEQLDFKSPLSKYRNYYTAQEDDPLFRVVGMPEGARVRLATMDEFDGIVWNVSTVDRTNGASAFDRATRSQSSTAITVTIDEYTGPWVPTIGGATGITLSNNADPEAARRLLQNDETGAVAQLGDVRSGDVYTVDWSENSSAETLPDSAVADRSVSLQKPSRKLPQLDKLAQTWIAQSGASSDFEIATAVEQGFALGFFSDGRPDGKFPTPSGHGARRIANLIADPARMIGNDEQYASAMAMEMQTLGMPARVILGFEADKGPEFTGDDIAAWVEIKFVGAGWVSFDPTPPEDQQPAILQEDPNPVPQANVVQPPVLPHEPGTVDSAAPEGAGENLGGRIWEIILAILGYVWTFLKIAVLLSPVWGLLLAKHLRRKRRRGDPDPMVRLSGGWREVTDRARDLGTTLPRSQTRYESSVVLAERYPEAALPPLATLADRHVFGPVDPADDEIEAYWADVDTALSRMRKAAPWWRRPLAWVSPASIPWRAVGADVMAKAQSIGQSLLDSRIGRRAVGMVAAVRERVNTVIRRKAQP